jgi:hypothetical protein
MVKCLSNITSKFALSPHKALSNKTTIQIQVIGMATIFHGIELRLTVPFHETCPYKRI